MQFGVPSKRKKKVEKYPNTPVITLPGISGKGKSRRLEFNNEAFRALGLQFKESNEIAFSLEPTDLSENLILNANKFSSGANLKVTKQGAVSNKKHYDELKTRFNIKTEDDLELTVIDTGRVYNDTPIFKVIRMDVDNKEGNEMPSESN